MRKLKGRYVHIQVGNPSHKVRFSSRGKKEPSLLCFSGKKPHSSFISSFLVEIFIHFLVEFCVNYHLFQLKFFIQIIFIMHIADLWCNLIDMGLSIVSQFIELNYYLLFISCSSGQITFFAAYSCKYLQEKVRRETWWWTEWWKRMHKLCSMQLLIQVKTVYLHGNLTRFKGIISIMEWLVALRNQSRWTWNRKLHFIFYHFDRSVFIRNLHKLLTISFHFINIFLLHFYFCILYRFEFTLANF